MILKIRDFDKRSFLTRCCFKKNYEIKSIQVSQLEYKQPKSWVIEHVMRYEKRKEMGSSVARGISETKQSFATMFKKRKPTLINISHGPSQYVN